MSWDLSPFVRLPFLTEGNARLAAYEAAIARVVRRARSLSTAVNWRSFALMMAGYALIAIGTLMRWAFPHALRLAELSRAMRTALNRHWRAFGRRLAAIARVALAALIRRKHTFALVLAVSLFAGLLFAVTSPLAFGALLLSVLTGAIMGAGVAALQEVIADRLFDPSDIERRTGLAVLTAAPRLKKATLYRFDSPDWQPAAFLLQFPLSHFGAAYRKLRGSIGYGGVGACAPVVAVTSALAGEGKTTASLCLARVAALSGERVLLIDCDLDAHSLTNLLALKSKGGLVEALSGQRHWRSCVMKDEPSGAHLLPVQPLAFTPRAFGSLTGAEEVLREMRGEYDLVVLDCPPVLERADTPGLAAKADAAIFIASAGVSQARAVRKAARQIRGGGGRILGVVLNQSMHDAGPLSYKRSVYRPQPRKFDAAA